MSCLLLLSLCMITSAPSCSAAQKQIKLYTYPHCPACIKVKKHLEQNNLQDQVVIINADEPKNYEELKKVRNDGKDYCPYLVDEVHNVNMSESNKIIAYFKTIFN